MVSILRLSVRLASLSLALALTSGVAPRGRAEARGADGGLVEVESLASVEARRQAASDLAAAAASLHQTGDAAQLVKTLGRLAEVRLKLSDADSALSAAQ